ncbi:hypothetical protein RB195_000305 [Necator americanus]|uniref:Uncharacterized protein n=1 Tax=Necator americanus TaxID=51031 RepID=A0ABR1D8Y8_NECAM
MTLSLPRRPINIIYYVLRQLTLHIYGPKKKEFSSVLESQSHPCEFSSAKYRVYPSGQSDEIAYLCQ